MVLWLALALPLASACNSSPTAPAAPPALRIAVMAPGAAEMLQSLGKLSAVVGIGDFVSWPPELRDRPRLGAYNAPSTERVLGLRVNLFVTARSAAASANLARLRELGVRVLELDTDTYAGTLRSLIELGAAVGEERRAKELQQQMEARMKALGQRVSSLARRRVLFVVGRDPLYVAGPGSHIDEMITAAGGTNLAADAASTYQLVSAEAMLERLPEVIIDTSDNRPGSPRGRQSGSWSQWPFLPAVKENRVYLVDPSRLSIPGPRLPEMSELLAKMIHPELQGPPTEAEMGPMEAPAPTPAAPSTTPAAPSPPAAPPSPAGPASSP